MYVGIHKVGKTLEQVAPAQYEFAELYVNLHSKFNMSSQCNNLIWNCQIQNILYNLCMNYLQELYKTFELVL